MSGLTTKNHLLLSLVILLFGIMTLTVTTESVLSQEDEYYQEVEENYEEPLYDDPQYEGPQYDESLNYEDYPAEDDQNPDPEFMDEVEPGEYDQSDDVTEMNLDYN